MADDISQNIADASAPKTDGAKLAAFWQTEMTSARTLHKDWHLRGDKIIDRYMDERNESTDRDLVKAQRRMNILWSNVETLKPTLLAKAPVPNVSRANKDKDPVGRWASIVLERCLMAQMRDGKCLEALKEARSDLLLPGRGIVFESYDPEVEGEGDAAKVTTQRTRTEYVHWKNFYTNRARNWFEVWFVAKEAFLTRKELHRKYDATLGAAKVNAIPLDHKPEDNKKVESEQFNKATVYQIWDKNSGDIVEIAKEYKDDVLAKMKPPVEFEDFFPCPRPLFATLGGNSIIPTPDYAEYQDQAEEIDLMTNRIHGLTKALKVRGAYDASFSALAQIFNDAGDQEMVPVESFALFGEKGGMAGVMQFVPIKEVAGCLMECMKARDDAKRSMYEVTGISDIVRGASVASETATAQQLKSQWGSIRIRDRQQDVERFARDVLRLKSAIIASQFTQETLAAMSNVKLLTQQEKAAVVAYQQMMQQRAAQQQAQQQPQGNVVPMPGAAPPPPPPPPVSQDKMAMVSEPTWEEVIALLRNEELRSFVIDIETDSTIEPDQNQQREQRTGFVTAVTQFMMAAEKILMPAPQMAPLMGELLLFAVRGWKVGEQMETKIEEAVALMEKKAAEPQQAPPDAKMLAVQQAPQIEQIKQQGENQRTAATLASEDKRAGVDASLEHGWQQLDAAKLMHSTGHANADRGVQVSDGVQKRTHEAQQGALQRQHDKAQAAMPIKTEGPA